MGRVFFSALAAIGLLAVYIALVDAAAGDHPAVVRVRVPLRGELTAYGSGTLVGKTDRRGWVLTNAHVIRGVQGDPVCFFPCDAAEPKGGYTATIVGKDATKDLALLRIRPPRVEPIMLADALDTESRLTIAGHGGGRYVEQVGKFGSFDADRFAFWLSPARARQGDSGGPVFDRNGRLAACLFGNGGLDDQRRAINTTWATRVESIREFLRTTEIEFPTPPDRRRAAFDASDDRGAPGVAWTSDDAGMDNRPAPAFSQWGIECPDPRLAFDVPADIRYWYRNPDGSCVQCSIGMCGTDQNVPEAATLLWTTEYGKKERGGSGPSRVAEYSRRRGIRIFNITGNSTWDWMKWCCRNGRGCAIGAGSSHFQTLVGYDPPAGKWYVCNNNSPRKIDEYSEAGFKRLHLASGTWIVVLDYPPHPPRPEYRQWW